MDRRITQLVSKIKQRSNNDGSSGSISDAEIMDSINDAQESIQEIIVNNFGKKMFMKTSEITLSGTYEESLPADIYNSHYIDKIEFTTSINPGEQNWSKMHKISHKESHIGNGWYIRNNKIYIPYSSGTIRVFYPGKLPRLDKRQGTITQLSPLKISGQDNDLSQDDWFCIVDQYGNIKQSAIFKTSFNEGAGTIVHEGSLSADVEVGHYVVLGKYASSHSELPNNYEKYLRTFAVVDLSIFDSDVMAQAEQAKLQKFENAIIDLAIESDGDITDIPIVEW